ncbi:MAG: exosortase U [Planctomycetaceae bacterium]
MARVIRGVLWVAAAGAGAVALGPLVADYAQQVWRSEHYRFAPLLLLAAAFLGVRRFRQVTRQPGKLGGRLLLWSGGILGAAGAVFAASPFAAVIAVMIISLAALYECGGRPLLRRLLPVWALVWLTIRPPFGWDLSFVVNLQKIATRAASEVLDLGRVRHVADGVAIRLADKSFFVDEACSGIHSLFAALAFAGVFSVVTGRGFVRTALLLVATVFWVLVANAMRICAVVMLSTQYDLPVTEGLGHELLGVATFAVAVALIMSTDRLLLFLVPERETGPLAQSPGAGWFEHEGRASHSSRRSVVTGRRGLLASGLVAIAFAGLAWGGWVLPSSAPTTYQSQLASSEGFKPLAVDDLPAEWNGWERMGFRVQQREAGDLAGELSRIWTYRKGRLVAAVSVDGPYDGWHDLIWCYEGLGYKIESVDDVTEADSTVHTELRMMNDLGRHGLVVYSAYTDDDRMVVPPRAARHDPLTRRLMAAIQKRLDLQQAPRSDRVYQVQVFSESGLGFTQPEQRELESLFRAMRDLLVEGSDRQAAEPTAIEARLENGHAVATGADT